MEPNKLRSIRLRLDQNHYHIENFTFSGGEVHVDLSYLPTLCHDYSIKARLQSGDDIMNFIMMCDAVHNRYPKATGTVVIPYLPYARQDRVCAEGQHFGLHAVAKVLGTIPQSHLVIYDPHSGVAVPQLKLDKKFTKVSVYEQQHIIERCQTLKNKIQEGQLQLVSPDFGAQGKTHKVHQILKSPLEVIHATKTRNPQTGWLETDELNIDLNGQDVLILDDICDGGATFLGLAKELKRCNAGRVVLYVTHGIFSKGVKTLYDGGIDHIYTTDSFDYDKTIAPARLTRIKL